MPEVLIVGGGLAGLCCARHLHRHGVPFQLYEAADAVGGRVRTDDVEGYKLDRGFQVLLTAYPEARRMLDYKALQLHRFYPGAQVRYGGRFYMLGDPFQKPRDLAATVMNPIGSFGDKVRVGMLRQRLRFESPAQLFAGEDIPTSDWLAARGFSPPMIERFFRPFLGGVFLDWNLHTSARMFRFVFKMFSTGAAAVPQNGMGAIPDQLLGSLPRERVHLDSPVSRVDREGVHLKDGRYQPGHCVIVATDQDTAGTWFPESPSRGWSATTCWYFEAAQPPVRQPVLVLNGDGKGLINNLHVVSQVNPHGAPPDRALISVTVLEQQSDEAAVRRELQSWFGESTASWRCLKKYTVPRALPIQPPGVLDPPERPVRTAAGMYRCGDYLDQASIQGAMVSGRRAAEAVLEDHGETLKNKAMTRR